MYETRMTVVGNLATGIDKQRLSDGTIVANFRVASTERRYDRAGGSWVDGDKLYIDVKCWRELAENAAASLAKGDRVAVTGRLYTREFEHEGQRRSAMMLEAQSVAADLSWCTAVLTRTRRQAGAASDSGGDRREPGEAVGATVATPDPGRGSAADASQLVAAVPGGEG